MPYIDTHCHLDGEEFSADRDAVVQRAREAGCTNILLPAIDLKSCHTVLATCAQYPGYCLPMLGLHPEEVRPDWRAQLAAIKPMLHAPVIAIGEVGLDTTGAVSLSKSSWQPSRSRCAGRQSCNCR